MKESSLKPETVKLNLSARQRDLIQTINASGVFQFADPDDCYHCGGRAFSPVAYKDRYGLNISYVSCVDCGYVFANPYYTEQSLKLFYENYYSEIYGRSGSERSVFEGEYINSRTRIMPLIRQYFRDYSSVLDYGCGYGGALIAFPDTWERVGYDYDDVQLSFGRKYGLDLRRIDSLGSLKKKFDVVMLNQVLEHVRDPIALLRSVQSLLKDDGILYIEVPGFETVIRENFDPRLIFKNAHRHYFCLSSLIKIASDVGLHFIDGNESVQSVFKKSNGAENGSKAKKTKMISSEEWFKKILDFQPNNLPKKNILNRLLNRMRRKIMVMGMWLDLLKK